MTESVQELFNKLATKQQLLWSRVTECYPGGRAEEEEELWVDLTPCHQWVSDDSPPRNTAPIPNVVSIDYDCDDEISDIGDIRHHHYKPSQRSRSHGSDGSNDSPLIHAVGSWMKNRYPRIDETLASPYASQPIEPSWEREQDLDHRGRPRATKERYYRRMQV
jgi:hypothetical protein